MVSPCDLRDAAAEEVEERRLNGAGTEDGEDGEGDGIDKEFMVLMANGSERVVYFMRVVRGKLRSRRCGCLTTHKFDD